jgi:hypothetical protein
LAVSAHLAKRGGFAVDVDVAVEVFFNRVSKIAAATAERQFQRNTVETGVGLEDDNADQTE